MVGHIAIIGTGLVGSGWAIVFARAGHQVRAFDANPASLERLPAHLRGALAAMREHGLVGDIEPILDRIEIVGTLPEAVTGALYVQESVVEVLEQKQKVAAQIDACLDANTIVGSSTSGIPSSAFTSHCAARARYLVAHPVNPPHLAPVVEIVPAPWTDPAAVEKTRVLMEKVGQEPVIVTREVPGFILNRLQGALLDEAWSLFDQGYASAEDIDKTIKFGLGLRWSFMGPFETIDLNAPLGIEDYARRLGPMYVELAGGRRPPGPWSEEAVRRATAERRAALPQDQIDARRVWRDEKLMVLRASQRRSGK